MSSNRDQAGRFPAGRSGNPNGRPKKGRGVDAAITRAVQEVVTVTEKGRSRRLTKLDITAKQVANQGASGNPRSMKLALDFARTAEENTRAEAARAPVMTQSDWEIADRLIARLTRIIREQED
ncbi:DUF5681 domain-containing protein [Humitalea sp. 24SJ18S-53]|uniref:DUF5681 domain-containing protein n=1 Tax=Humitalea sp. 24SJ18S-53 TaxID=3422307 RepID=UPI003D66BEA8